MYAHTKHTTLMQSNGDGVARFVVAHGAIVSKTPAFFSNEFKAFPKEQLFIAFFKFSGSKRYLLRTVAYTFTAADFKEKFATTLTEEDNAFKLRFGSGIKTVDTGSTRATPIHGHETIEQPEPSLPVGPINLSKLTIDTYNGTWVDGIYVKLPDLKLFMTALESSKEEPMNLLMVGPSGCGKTSIPQHLADIYGLKCLRVNCSAVRDPEEWFGYREAIDGSTEFVPTEFTKTVEAGHAIIILDEFNRVEPWLHNTLMPLLDHDRKTTIHGYEIKCGPELVFIATMNLGSNFTGTFMIDTAIVNRMDGIVKVGYMTDGPETKLVMTRIGLDRPMAAKIVAAMNSLRKALKDSDINIDASTRSSLKVAKLAKGGLLSLVEAFEFVVFNGVEDVAAIKSAKDAVNSILMA